MPFRSKAQARACYAKKRRGEAGSWDCDEWAEHTDFDKLPERSSAEKKSQDQLLSLAKMARALRQWRHQARS